MEDISRYLIWGFGKLSVGQRNRELYREKQQIKVNDPKKQGQKGGKHTHQLGLYVLVARPRHSTLIDYEKVERYRELKKGKPYTSFTKKLEKSEWGVNESGWFDLCVFLCGFETLNGGFFFFFCWVVKSWLLGLHFGGEIYIGLYWL